MSTRFFSSPRTATAAAAIAPAKLAAAADDAVVRWRTRSDGTLEVLSIRGGVVDRYLVNDDGTTARLETLPMSYTYRWGRRVAFAGWGICLLAILVGGMAGLGPTFIAPLFFLGFFIFGLAGILHARAEDFDRRLDGGGWHEPTELHGWVPRSGRRLS